MISSGKPFMTVTFEDGSFAVARTDPRKPQLLEVIAIFYDAARARSYAEMENGRSGAKSRIAPAEAPQHRTKSPQRHFAEPTEVLPELSPRQSAVLGALRAKMDETKRVEAKAVALAEAAHIPLGSLHSVLQSLEKKQLITTARAGSARAPAVYQVL